MPTPFPSPLPLVLDTNVVLDVLVFDDPVSRPLAEGLATGSLTAWADASTLRELQLVLAMPSFRLEAEAQRALLARYEGMVRVAPGEAQAPLTPLPRCADRDDQKFLELAARVGAVWLVSKDKQVLQLAGGSTLPFAILSPRKAVQRLPGAPDAG